MDIVKIYEIFPNQQKCLEYLEKVRWNDKSICPYCQSSNTTSMPKEFRHHCNTCNTSFSVTVRSIFHKTKLDLQKWFLAISLILNAKKGISARQLARDLKVDKNTAWYMAMRIRKAMIEQRELMNGLAEMDETYIGGKQRKGNAPSKRSRGTSKTPVDGFIERGGDVRAAVQKKLDAKNLSRLVRENVDIKASMTITDEFKSYLRPKAFANHRVIDHQRCYVNGDIHTNNIESSWALLNKGIIRQYHKVSVYYLNNYIAEFCYRHNNRNNPEIFSLTITRTME